jgi:hypothetical protein
MEHASERVKQQKMLISFLRTGRGIPFSQMFAMKDYPRDILPLYAQGHSLASYLVAQGGKQKFLNYLAEGLQSEQWVEVTARHYGYANLATLQNTWLDWVRRGSPALPASTADTTKLIARQDRPRPASNLVVRGQSPDTPVTASPVVPIRGRGPQPAAAPAPAELASSEPAPVASPGWRPAGTRPAADVALAAQRVPSAETPAADKLTEEPPVARKPRQPILEWSRPQSAAADVTPRAPAAGRSVYETSAVPPQTLTR